jgi:hypothetical protein
LKEFEVFLLKVTKCHKEFLIPIVAEIVVNTANHDGHEKRDTTIIGASG